VFRYQIQNPATGVSMPVTQGNNSKMKNEKPEIGIGACLVGQAVRYNGDSKRSNPHIDRLQDCLSPRAFCPEMAIGLGVPRETVRLVGEPGDLRLTDSATQSANHTAAMVDYAARVVEKNPDMAGYILVKGSPSCGYQRVKRYNEDGNAVASDASGVFATALMQLDPLLPVEEDGRLHDDRLRENFISRVYAYHDWKQLLKTGISRHSLTGFWARYKYQAMASDVSGYRQIGRMLAESRGVPLEQLAEKFITLLMRSLAKLPTRKSHSNVLQHLRGYLKRDLDGGDKRELDTLIGQYRSGVVPLVVPVTLLQHHFKKFSNAYIDQQVYMRPYPEQLMLRNHI
jgi:uncharacterized protein YbgA (DUF1722 family)/uncharacterized protein YbbK (DUF523 family)